VEPGETAGTRPPVVTIQLLGDPVLGVGSRATTAFDSARAEALVAFLVLHRDAPVARDRVAAALWPESTSGQARTNLRHLLHTLRQRLPAVDELVEPTSRTLRWRGGPTVRVDVVVFQDGLDRGDTTGLRAAVDIYRGDLLAGSYEEWVLAERERLRQAYLGALERLARLLGESADHAAAIEYGQLLVGEDPLREAGYRLLMRVHAAEGDRAQALYTYHSCVAVLDSELGVRPSSETTRLYEDLMRASGADVAPASAAPTSREQPTLVGRQTERALLSDLWRAAERGQPQVLVVSGEAGIGKSRLVEALRAWAARRGAVTATGAAYAAEGALAYGPVLGWLRSETIASSRRRLSDQTLSEVARLLPELLVERPGLLPPLPMPENVERQRLYEAASDALVGTGRPALLVAEDIQWWDQESVQLLHYLVRTRRDARLLVAATCRTDEVADNVSASEVLSGLRLVDRLTEVVLARLTDAETTQLAQQLLGEPLDTAAAGRLFADTEGNPLFVVEAVRAGWDGLGESPHPTPKVEAVIRSRLRHLSDVALDLVLTAATVGRSFTGEVLAAVEGADEDELVRGLDELWRRQIIRDEVSGGYDFSHDRIREAAYLSMSPAQRRRRHRAVARAVERAYPGSLDERSGQLALHYDRAGDATTAVPWYLRAADAAGRMVATREAIALLDRALELVTAMPPTADRQVVELGVRTARLPALAIAEGFASPRLAAENSTALQLANAAGVEPSPLLVRSLAITRLSASDFDAARTYGELLRSRGHRDADPVLVVEGEYVLGICAFWGGDVERAREHFEAAVAHYRDEDRPAHVLRYMLDPKVICLSRLGNTWWFLGRPDRAVGCRDEALAFGAAIDHAPSLGTALAFAAMLDVDMADWDTLRRHSAALDEVAHLQRPTMSHARAISGLVAVLDGHPEDGVERIRSVLHEPDAGEHAPGFVGCMLRILLAACEITGDTRTGLTTADQILSMGGTARVWEPTARRMRTAFAAGAAMERPRNAVS
jgi:DNA-binding SARP family transcriptional activator